MKIQILLIVSILIFGKTNAQKNSKISFNVGGELGFATGNLNLFYSVGIGATAQLDYEVDDKIRITANSGIIQYAGRKLQGTALKNQSNAVIPVLAGAKYFFAENFYGNLQLGVSLFTGKLGSNKFTYIPGLGFYINDKVDLLLKYTGYTNLGGAFGVRLGYAL